MYHSYYEQPRKTSPLGIHIAFQTLPGGFAPLHWHETLEILYPLNGDVDLLLEGEAYCLPPRKLTVINPRHAHSTLIRGKSAMNICIHVSMDRLKSYIPDIDRCRIDCILDKICDEKKPVYEELCQMMDRMTELYISETPEVCLESEGIVLQLLAYLLRYFGVREEADSKAAKAPIDRIHQILYWTEEHYGELISLNDVAAQINVSREYFCRLFRRSMGITYQEYLTGIRLDHAYQELLHTDAPVSEVMENNGFVNQKKFNASFKKLYGHTPSEVRRQK